jgi:long-chain fatty acid transport protein
MKWVVFFSIFGVATAAASPLQMFGFGGRSPGMGATGVSTCDGFDCVYLNPAGLSDLRRKRFSAGTLVGDFQLDGVDRPIDAATGLEIGGAVPIPLGGILKDRVGLAFGLYIPTSVLNRARTPEYGTPFYVLLENRAQVVGLQFGVGVRLSERWSVGAGLLALAALKGRIEIRADAAGRFATTSEQQLIAAYSPIVGGRWQLRDDLTLGLSARLAARSSFDIVLQPDFGSALPLSLPELRIAGTAQYDPLTASFEAAWRPRSRLLLTGQIAWEHWSAFPHPAENVVERMPDRAPVGFHDTVVPRVGVEWSHLLGRFALSLRGGYFFALSPASGDASAQGFLDNHRHAFSAGIGFDDPTTRFPLHVDLWFQAHILQPRDHGGEVETSGSIVVGGIVLGVDL